MSLRLSLPGFSEKAYFFPRSLQSPGSEDPTETLFSLTFPKNVNINSGFYLGWDVF